MPLPRAVTSSISRLSRQARFVFTGTIEREGGSSLSALPAGRTTTVVRVARIHHAAPALRNQTGQELTVILPDGSAPGREARDRVFFTDPALFGETLGVREIGSIEVPNDIEALQNVVDRVNDERREDELRSHLSSADAVVFGRVVGVRPADPSAVPGSEHDPLWWIATILVVRPFRGDIEGEIEIRYPNSRDIRWYRVPKPDEGQEGFFIIHRDGRQVGDVELALLHADDLLPVDEEELERLARLM